MRKSFAFMAACALMPAAWAETTVLAPVANTIGYACIDSRRAYLPIAISYDDSAVVSGVDIAVKDVVQTATLTVGDELYVYNHVRHGYDTYTLATNETETAKEWVADESKRDITLQGCSVQKSVSADENLLSKGYGLWLHRKGCSTNGIVHVMGQLATNIVVKVQPGEAVLLGVPTEFDKDGLDLKSPKSPFNGKAAKNDLVEVPQDDGSLAIYRFNGTSWTAATRGKVLANIPAGSAFWYVRKGSTVLTADWAL